MNKLYNILNHSNSAASVLWKKAVMHYETKEILLEYLFAQFPALEQYVEDNSEFLQLFIEQNRYNFNIKCNSNIAPINLIFKQQATEIADILLDELITKKIITKNFKINFAV